MVEVAILLVSATQRFICFCTSSAWRAAPPLQCVQFLCWEFRRPHRRAALFGVRHATALHFATEVFCVAPPTATSATSAKAHKLQVPRFLSSFGKEGGATNRKHSPSTMSTPTKAAAGDLLPAVEAYLEANGLKKSLASLKTEAKAAKLATSAAVRCPHCHPDPSTQQRAALFTMSIMPIESVRAWSAAARASISLHDEGLTQYYVVYLAG